MTEKEKRFNVLAAADEAGMCATSMRKLIADGKIGHLRINRRIYLTRSHIDQFLTSCERLPASHKRAVRKVATTFGDA